MLIKYSKNARSLQAKKAWQIITLLSNTIIMLLSLHVLYLTLLECKENTIWQLGLRQGKPSLWAASRFLTLSVNSSCFNKMPLRNSLVSACNHVDFSSIVHICASTGIGLFLGESVKYN